MQVQVTPGQPARLDGLDELARFSVAIAAAPETLPALAAAFDGVLAFDDADHVWVSVHWLLDASGRADAPAWRAAFDAMVDYAASKGWTRADRSALRGHIVWQADAA